MDRCEANGCPLIGHKEYHTSQSLCFFHNGKHYSDFGKITNKILKVQFAIDHWWMCKKASPHEFLNDAKYHNHPRIGKKEDENHFQYIDRLWDMITDYIQKGIKPAGLDEHLGIRNVNELMGGDE